MYKVTENLGLFSKNEKKSYTGLNSYKKVLVNYCKYIILWHGKLAKKYTTLTNPGELQAMSLGPHLGASRTTYWPAMPDMPVFSP